MERFVLVNCSVLFLIVIIQAVLSVPYNYEAIDPKSEEDDRKSYLWFGPRLGRKKRNNPHGNGDELYRGHQEQGKEQLVSLMDAIDDSPWAIVAVNEGKRHPLNYTPRLGRDSGEDLGGDRWLQDQDFTDVMSQRSPPFAPRLGRRFTPHARRDQDNNHN